MHLKSLDAARGIAACLVAVDHFLLIVVDPADDSALHYGAAFMGSFGVGLFFLISGLVIPQTLRRGSWDYAIRRIWRIYPVAVAGTALAMGVDLLDGGDNETFGATASLAGIFFHGNDALLMPIFWTLTIEVTFYVLAGVLGALTGRGNDGVIVYLALLSVCAGVVLVMNGSIAGDTPAQVATLVVLSCWPMLFMGWFTELFRSGAIGRPLLLVGIVGALVTLTQSPYPYFGWSLGAPSWVLALGAFLWLVFGSPPELSSRFGRLLLSVGTVTFPVYVVHVPVADALARPDLPVAVLALAYVALVTLLSFVALVAVERPGIRAGKWMAGWRIPGHQGRRPSQPSSGAVVAAPVVAAPTPLDSTVAFGSRVGGRPAVPRVPAPRVAWDRIERPTERAHGDRVEAGTRSA